MIRQATIEDFNQIRAIRKKIGLQREQMPDESYREKVEKKGFLLFPDTSLEDFKNDLKKDFFVFEEDGAIKGYICGEFEQEISRESQVHWYKPEMKEIYFEKPHAGIDVIAVDPTFANHGIATKLLDFLISKLQGKVEYIYSLIVFSPVKNIPSIKFHEKNGFEKIAITNYKRLFDLDNYQSLLYAKKI